MEGLQGRVGGGGAGGQGRGTAGGARLTGLLFSRSLESECDEFRLGFLGVVLGDVAGFKGFATLHKGINPKADGTVSLTLGDLLLDKAPRGKAGRIRVRGRIPWGAGSARPGSGSDLCGCGRGDGGVGLNGLGGTGKYFASCLEGLQVQVSVLVALDGAVMLDGFV